MHGNKRLMKQCHTVQQIIRTRSMSVWSLPYLICHCPCHFCLPSSLFRIYILPSYVFISFYFGRLGHLIPCLKLILLIVLIISGCVELVANSDLNFFFLIALLRCFYNLSSYSCPFHPTPPSAENWSLGLTCNSPASHCDITSYIQ